MDLWPFAKLLCATAWSPTRFGIYLRWHRSVGAVLVVGGPIEKLLVRRYGSDAEREPPASQKETTSTSEP